MSSIAAAGASPTRRDRLPVRLVLVLAAGSIVMGVVAGAMVESGRGFAVFALGIVAVFVVLWRVPQASPVVLLAAVLAIEQFATSDGPPGGTFTDRIPLFHGLSKNVHIDFADLLVLALFVLYLLKRGTGTVGRPSRSAVGYAMTALAAAVMLGLLVGRMHGGSLRTSFTEVRPYAYLVAAFVLASVFARTLDVLRWAMWAIVLTSGAKATQAVILFLSVRHERPRPEAILGHEEALFFGLYVLVTFGLWLFDIRGRLRTVATWLLPVVILADLVNGRRAAWLILGGALIVLIAIGLAVLPERRRFLLRLCAVLLLVSMVYFPVYWHHTGSLALPARAVRSAIHPDTRDSLSDLYRIQENANLKVNIREGGMLGRGFGVPIDYVLPITNLSAIDPLIAYIPHDGVLYILMRMGLLGGIAFWSLIGAAIISACRLARSVNREVACFGAVVACAVVGYTLEGYNDQGFFFYRIAFVMGILLGLCEAARRITARAATAEPAER
jgi:hypothetical protein